MSTPQEKVRDRLHREGAFDRKYSSADSGEGGTFVVVLWVFLLFLIPFPIAATIFKNTGINYMYAHLLGIAVMLFVYKGIKTLIHKI